MAAFAAGRGNRGRFRRPFRMGAQGDDSPRLQPPVRRNALASLRLRDGRGLAQRQHIHPPHGEMERGRSHLPQAARFLLRERLPGRAFRRRNARPDFRPERGSEGGQQEDMDDAPLDGTRRRPRRSRSVEEFRQAGSGNSPGCPRVPAGHRTGAYEAPGQGHRHRTRHHRLFPGDFPGRSREGRFCALRIWSELECLECISSPDATAPERQRPPIPSSRRCWSATSS